MSPWEKRVRLWRMLYAMAFVLMVVMSACCWALFVIICRYL